MKNNRKKVARKSHKYGTILGITISGTPEAKVLRFVRDHIGQGKKFFIVTPNPEIIMRAQKDRELFGILNSSDLALPDGIGLAAARKFLSLPNPKNPYKRLFVLLAQGLGVGFSLLFDKSWLLEDFKTIKGREMFLELCKLANKKPWRVFLLGGKGRVAEETAQALKRSLKKVQIEALGGPILDREASPISKRDKVLEKQAVSAINKFKPHLLFVAFKFPRQEKWVYKWLPKLDVGGAMVVGGTFNYISGRSKLPPTWIAEAGLEWLWRLVTEPRRVRRIFKAVFVFSYRVFLYKLNRADLL